MGAGNVKRVFVKRIILVGAPFLVLLDNNKDTGAKFQMSEWRTFV